MSVCPGCGRCRECGHIVHPRPIYPWYGPTPTIYPTSPNIYPTTAPYIGTPVPFPGGTITVTS